MNHHHAPAGHQPGNEPAPVHRGLTEAQAKFLPARDYLLWRLNASRAGNVIHVPLDAWVHKTELDRTVRRAHADHTKHLRLTGRSSSGDAA